MFATVGELMERPGRLVSIVAAYSLAFVLRAYAWRLYLRERITVREALYGLLYSLFVNHISPVKIGEAVRVAVITGNDKIPVAEAAQSVVVLRLLDLLVLGCFGAAGMMVMLGKIDLNWIFVCGGITGGILICLLLWKKAPRFMQTQLLQLKGALQGIRGIAILFLTAASWVLEAFVIYGIASSLPFSKAVWVNSVTIAGQVFQLTPGGIGTYETVMTFALQAAAVPASSAYEWAVISHSFKFAFSYAAGLVLLIVHPMKLTALLSDKLRGEEDWWKK